MKKSQKLRNLRLVSIVVVLLMSTSVWAELPTATQIASKMKLGLNIGNTLECPYGETGWGAPKVTKLLIDSIKAAGFNSVRLPCAWFTHSDTTTNVINVAWLARVKEIVDYCIKDSMYVMLNIHWDSGWLENHVTVTDSARVNKRQRTYWIQIANYFRNYGDHLLFACANEPNNLGNATGRTVFESYVQTFIKAVRATGANNSSRTLIYQGEMNYATVPKDQITGRVMFEVHNYPYQFTILDKDKPNPYCGGCGDTLYVTYYWGKGNHSLTDLKHNPTYNEEADVDNFYKTLKTRFVDKGVPVILGEYAAGKRGDLTAGADTALHYKSVEYFHYRMVKGALLNGAIPFRWDTPGGIINRNTGAIQDRGIMNAMKKGAAEAAQVISSVATVNTNGIEIYPNPFTSTFILKVDNPDEIKGISVFDLMGRQVETIGRSSVNSTLALGASLKPNMYIVQITGKNWTKSFKIVKR